MIDIKRGLDVLTKENRAICLEEIIAYFHDERNEEIGVIAAESVLDFFLEKIGPDIYNQAIDDSKKALQKSLEGLDFEIELLKKQK